MFILNEFILSFYSTHTHPVPAGGGSEEGGGVGALKMEWRK